MSQHDSEIKKKTEVKIPCEVYSRVVGYMRPVSNWNLGKQQEFSERKYFKVNEKEINNLGNLK